MILGGKVAMLQLEQVHIKFLHATTSWSASHKFHKKFCSCRFWKAFFEAHLASKHLARLQQMDESGSYKAALETDMQSGLKSFADIEDELRLHDIRIPRSLKELDLVATSHAPKDSFTLSSQY